MAEQPLTPSVTPSTEEHALWIGAWQLMPALHTLRRGDTTHRLPKRLVRLLQVLAERPGSTHTREELLDAVWDRKFVNDEVLSRAIAELRNLLGDDVRAPAYIETLPKTGYRLIAEVRRSESLEAHAVPDRPVDGTEAVTASALRVAGPATAKRVVIGPGLILAALLGLVVVMMVPRTRHAPNDDPGAARTPAWSAERMLAERPFLSGPEWERQPRFSLDGRWLLHIAQDPQTQGTEVRYSAADGSASRALVAGPGRLSGPVFSPDGTRVAVIARLDGTCAVRLIDLPSGVPRQIADCAPQAGTALDWPEPGRLLFTAPAVSVEQGAGLWALDPDSGALHQLTFPSAEDIADTHPRSRADGTIAFLRGPFGQQRIWRWTAGEASLLLDSADRIPDLAWTADGEQLLVSSDRDGYPALHILHIADGQARLLGGRGAATLDRAADDSLVYEQRRYDANIWQYFADAPRRQLTQSTRYDAYPSLAPDNQRMVYLSNRDGIGSAWVQNLLNGEEHRLALPETMTWVRPSWLDAQTLGVTRYRDDRTTELVAFDLASGLPARDHMLNGSGFAALALGESNYLFGRGHEAAQGMQLWLASPSGQMSIEGAKAVSEFRADDQWMVWQRRGSSGLWLRAHRGTGPALHLPAPAKGQDYAAWTVAAGWLVYAQREGSAWSLWRLRLPDGASERWMDLDAAPADAQIAVANDLAFALVTHIDEFSADLLRVPAP